MGIVVTAFSCLLIGPLNETMENLNPNTHVETRECGRSNLWMPLQYSLQLPGRFEAALGRHIVHRVIGVA